MSQLCSVESEQGLLGSILKNPQIINDISLTVDDFYREQHKELFSLMLSMSIERTPIDMISIVERLMSTKKLDKVGGSIYLVELEGLTSGNQEYAEHYATVIKDYSVKRSLLQACQGGVELITKSNSSKSEELLDKVQSNIMSINGPLTGGFKPVSVIANSVADEILENIKNAGEVSGVPTGIKILDKHTGGWQPTDLIVLAGRPGMGKTAVMLNLFDNAAQLGYPVGCFSLEMSNNQLVYRLVSRRTGISYQRMKLGLLDPGQAELISEALSNITRLPILIDDRAGITELEIIREARRMKRESDIQLLTIDYLQRVKPSNSGRSMAEELGHIVASFKNLAKELKIPVILLSQLNRKVEERDDKKPNLADLKASGDIEQEADIIMLLYRDEYYNKQTAKKNMIEIDIAKYRNGNPGNIKVGWNGKSQDIYQLVEGENEF